MEKKVFYPSTRLIGQDIKGLEEYLLAKQDGELICSQLSENFPGSIMIERLSTLATDQSLSIMPVQCLDPYEVAIDIVKKMT